MDGSIVPYAPRYRRHVHALTRRHPTYFHLDWQPITSWYRATDNPSALIYDGRGDLTGVLLLTPIRQGVTWIRLLTMADNSIFEGLIQYIQASYPIEQIAALESQPWLIPLLARAGFRQFDRIIHLERPSSPINPSDYPLLTIRRAQQREFSTIAQVDQAAFSPHWQMDAEDFRYMLRYTVWFTVAVVDDTIVGYQLSTVHSFSVHLTRLAVLPTWQGRGIGRALVENLIEKFPRKTVTVNTQASNMASQQLYQHLGFRYQHWETPVWHWSNR
ncbi:MAG: GNAT family N-acetyltransferase [Anaerolineales bacterium]|nr:GNAT family N-acetyltransferase [Anaerolineales bacterium]